MCTERPTPTDDPVAAAWHNGQKKVQTPHNRRAGPAGWTQAWTMYTHKEMYKEDTTNHKECSFQVQALGVQLRVEVREDGAPAFPCAVLRDRAAPSERWRFEQTLQEAISDELGATAPCARPAGAGCSPKTLQRAQPLIFAPNLTRIVTPALDGRA